MFFAFADKHGLTQKNKIPNLQGIIKVNRKTIVAINKASINSYVAALIADFLREELLAAGISFSFETVMSDERKIDLAKRAGKKGYRVYLYFVATIDPKINIGRVSQRVQLGGHNVNHKIILKRYNKSLSLLYEMVKLTNRAYLFDNSGKTYELVAEITDGNMLKINDSRKGMPNWFYHHIFLKAKREKMAIVISPSQT